MIVSSRRDVADAEIKQVLPVFLELNRHCIITETDRAIWTEPAARDLLQTSRGKTHSLTKLFDILVY